MLLQSAFLLFGLIAAFGLLLSLLIARRVRFSGLLPLAHGIAGFGALGFLLFVLTQTPSAPVHAWWAFGLLTIGFLGGIVLFRVLFPRSPPLLLVAGHGLIGLVGLYFLWNALA